MSGSSKTEEDGYALEVSLVCGVPPAHPTDAANAFLRNIETRRPCGPPLEFASVIFTPPLRGLRQQGNHRFVRWGPTGNVWGLPGRRILSPCTPRLEGFGRPLPVALLSKHDRPYGNRCQKPPHKDWGADSGLAVAAGHGSPPGRWPISWCMMQESARFPKEATAWRGASVGERGDA